MLKQELRDFINKYFDEDIKDSHLDFLLRKINAKSFSVRNLENGLSYLQSKKGIIKYADFSKDLEKICYVKPTPGAIQSTCYSYPNKDTEDFVEKILSDIEGRIQKKIGNLVSGVSRDWRVNYKKINKWEADKFNNLSKTFDILQSGEIKLKEHIQDDFINAIDKLLHDVPSWLKLEKTAYDKIRNNLLIHICIAFCDLIYDDDNMLYIDWIKDFLIDFSKMNIAVIKYINRNHKTSYDTDIHSLTEKIASRCVA